MKRSRIITAVLLGVMLMSSLPLAMAAPSQGLVNEHNVVLSQVEAVAGSGQYNYREGKGAGAHFRAPEGIVVLSDGQVAVADTRNQLIRIVEGDEVKRFAGFDALPFDDYGLPQGALFDGDNLLSSFNRPSGLAVDGEGNIIVADRANHAIRHISVEGQVTTIAGDGVLGLSDGIGEEARFYEPSAVAVAPDGIIYVADSLNHVIRRIDPAGEVTTLNAVSERFIEFYDGVAAHAGDFLDGDIETALFNEPSGLAIDEHGNLYVSDTGNHLIRYIDFATETVSTVAGQVYAEGEMYGEHALYATAGYENGTALSASFNAPKGIALTAEGGLVIADSMNHAVRYLYDGVVSTLAGSLVGDHGGAVGVNGVNLLHNPSDVSVDATGHIYIADTYNNRIVKYSLYEAPEGLTVSDELQIVVHNDLVTLPTAPILLQGRTMVSVEAMAETLGYGIVVDEMFSNQLTLTLGTTTVQVTVGESQAEITHDDELTEQVWDANPFVQDDIIYVPLRFIAEAFGFNVQWLPQQQTVVIR